MIDITYIFNISSSLKTAASQGKKCCTYTDCIIAWIRLSHLLIQKWYDAMLVTKERNLR